MVLQRLLLLVSIGWPLVAVDAATQPPRELLDRCSDLTDARFAALAARDAPKMEAIARQFAAECRGTVTTRSYLMAYQEMAIAASLQGREADSLSYAEQCIEISYAAITCHVMRIGFLVKLQRKREAAAAIGGVERMIAAQIDLQEQTGPATADPLDQKAKQLDMQELKQNRAVIQYFKAQLASEP